MIPLIWGSANLPHLKYPLWAFAFFFIGSMHQVQIIFWNTRESWGIFLPTTSRMVLRLAVVGHPNVYLYAFLIPADVILVTSFPYVFNPMALKKSSTVSPSSSDKENCIHLNTFLVTTLHPRPWQFSLTICQFTNSGFPSMGYLLLQLVVCSESGSWFNFVFL